MPSFTIVPAVLEDMPELALIFQQAFVSEPTFVCMAVGTTLEARVASSAEGYKKDFLKPGRRYFKAVDADTGRIAGFTSWHFPHTYTPEQIAAGDAEFAVPTTWTPGTVNTELSTIFFTKIMTNRQKNVVRDDMFFTNVLAVRPEYQRNGLGRMLLKPGLETADKEGKRTYIEATREGLGLYVKLGWKQFDELVTDLVPYGGTVVGTTTLMMREPGSGL